MGFMFSKHAQKKEMMMMMVFWIKGSNLKYYDHLSGMVWKRWAYMPFICWTRDLKRKSHIENQAEN